MLNETDLSRADLNLLIVFDAVASERHVGRAAQKLNLSASAVSHGLGRLRRLFNDPLFLRTPRGVVPTDRADSLAEPVSELLAQARRLLASSEPFDVRRTVRRFMIGAPDGVSVVFLSNLLASLRSIAPGISIGIRQLLPSAGETVPERAWQGAFAELETRAIDVAIIPSAIVPQRIDARALFDEDFVVVARAGHPFAMDPTVQRYCEMRHLVVSMSGDSHGFVDDVLADRGLKRTVAVTVPTFMFALSVVSETDFIAALPRRLVARYGPKFGVVSVEPPVPFGTFQLHATTLKSAKSDAGLAWLLDVLPTLSEIPDL